VVLVTVRGAWGGDEVSGVWGRGRFPFARVGGGEEGDAAFEFADRVEVFVEFELIVAAETGAEGSGVIEDEVEEGAAVGGALEVCGGGGAAGVEDPEETLEGELGVDFAGDGLGGRAP
jgi:hypothetical protein